VRAVQKGKQGWGEGSGEGEDGSGAKDWRGGREGIV